jgi:hypothetical protein
MSSPSALPPQIHDDACAILAEAAKDMAITKNVRLFPGQEGEVAAMAIKALDTAIIYGLIRCEVDSVALAAATVDCLLDGVAACHAIQVMRALEGFDQLNPDQTLAHAGAWIKQRVANDTGDRRLRWPDPMDMAIRYFRARSSGPVAIQFSGAVRAAYLVDPLLLGSGKGERGSKPALASLPSGAVRDGEAARARPIPARKQADGFMPEPLLIRCPPFSHVHRTPLPDGRRIQKLSDGCVLTTYWKNGVLHRDPSAGPAWHRIELSGERSEYIVADCVHRDHNDGPAVVDTSWGERKLQVEEYVENGKRHRPAEKGPAVIYRHPDGQLFAEQFWENGALIEERFGAEAETADA